MYQRVNFSFLENPATEEEKLIASVVQTYCTSLQKRDFKTLSSLFADTAHIHSLAAKQIVSPDQFIQALKSSELFFSSKIQLSDLRIQILTPTTATVFGYHQYYNTGQESQLRILELKFQKQLRKWLITALKYQLY